MLTQTETRLNSRPSGRSFRDFPSGKVTVLHAGANPRYKCCTRIGRKPQTHAGVLATVVLGRPRDEIFPVALDSAHLSSICMKEYYIRIKNLRYITGLQALSAPPQPASLLRPWFQRDRASTRGRTREASRHFREDSSDFGFEI